MQMQCIASTKNKALKMLYLIDILLLLQILGSFRYELIVMVPMLLNCKWVNAYSTT